MTQCFGYVRVSTLKQGDGASLEAQKDAITGFASQQGLVITDWFEELETASKRGRPIFDGMMRKLEAGKAQGVIVHRWDRSARNFTDWAAISELADRGIKVFCAGDNIDFESRSGRLMADIQMVLAADYSRNLSIEVQKGQNQRLKQGYWPWRAPLGYVDTGEGKLKKFCPIKSPLVKEVFDRYLTGDYSITSLTDVMRERGLTGYYNQPLVRRNVEQILRNPYYCGQLKCSRGVFDGAHKPLITVATFQKVQKIKASKSTKKATKHSYLFRNLINCSACGRILTGERQKAHIYYRCHTKGCPEKSYREDVLEAAASAAVSRIRWTDVQIETFRRKLASRDLFADQDAMRSSLNLRAAEIQTRQSRLTDLFVDGNINDAEYQMRKGQLKLDLTRIDEERKALGELKKRQGSLAELVTFVCSLPQLYGSATSSQKRRLLRQLFEAVETQSGSCMLKEAGWVKDPVGSSSTPASLTSGHKVPATLLGGSTRTSPRTRPRRFGR
ncbi:recombinase family protein [Gymnodinialimonas sp.]